MTEHRIHEPAGVGRRTEARILDTCAMAVILVVTSGVTRMVEVLVVRSLLSNVEGSWVNVGGYWVLDWVPSLVPSLVAAYWFEVVSTARSGQTWGKRLAGVRLVRWDGEAAVGGQDRLERWRIGARWAVPHVAGIAAAVVVGIAVWPSAQDSREFLGPVAGAAAMPWALVYASSLRYKNGRGWHDMIAGTIAVGDRVEPRGR